MITFIDAFFMWHLLPIMNVMTHLMWLFRGLASSYDRRRGYWEAWLAQPAPPPVVHPIRLRHHRWRALRRPRLALPHPVLQALRPRLGAPCPCVVDAASIEAWAKALISHVLVKAGMSIRPILPTKRPWAGILYGWKMRWLNAVG